MSTKPTILFVPGAWHKAACYTLVIDALHTLGYETATAELASVGASPGLETWADDISNIQQSLTSLTSAGKEIIIVAHSYSSLPAGEAIKGFLARERSAENQHGGVIHIVYISAFILPASTSLMDALNTTDLPWFDVSASKTEVQPRDPATIFYNDLPPEVQKQQVEKLDVFSYQMYFQKTTWAPWKEVACSYLFCTLDNAVPFQVQQGMVKGTGMRFRETVVEAGHSPFLSRVGEVVGVIEGAAGCV